MSDTTETQRPRSRLNPSPGPVGLIASAVIGQSLAGAALAAIVGAAMHLAAKDLVIPFAMFDGCALVLAPLLVWTFRVPRGSRAFAGRLAVITFAYGEAIVLALSFGAMRLGVVSHAEGLHSMLPVMAIGIALSSPLTYAMARGQTFSSKRTRTER